MRPTPRHLNYVGAAGAFETLAGAIRLGVPPEYAIRVLYLHLVTTGVGHVDQPDVVLHGPDVAYLPDEVERHYSCARRLLAVEPDLAAVALGRTLEAAAAHLGIKARRLHDAVTRMVSEGIITDGFRDALDHVRQLRNFGAHAGQPPVTEAQVGLAIYVTAQFLRNAFELPALISAARSEP